VGAGGCAKCVATRLVVDFPTTDQYDGQKLTVLNLIEATDVV
jgi:hypothetical protein